MQKRGVKQAYLLTDNASNYFERFGFEIIDRQHVDDAVKKSVEFMQLCPESATAMRKTLT